MVIDLKEVLNMTILIFNNSSFTLCFTNDLKNFYEFASLIARELNLEGVLVYYSKSNYQLKIIKPI